MKKFAIVTLVLSLILFTAIVKNSTKRIDDEIYALQENIRILKKDFENTKLENDYLSSSENLLKFQKLYFDDELIKKDLKKIKVIQQKFDEIEIKQLKLINE